MIENDLRAMLNEAGLGRVADRLMRLAAPTIRIYLQRMNEEDIPAGASKMGGRPDLPDGVPWPVWHEPMAFIAQINLAAAGPYDIEAALPRHGLLSFFYETDGEPGYSQRVALYKGASSSDDSEVSRSWRILYHDDEPGTFVRREVPTRLNEQARYAPCAVRFALEYTLPDVDGPELQPLTLTEDERHTLIGLDDLINRGKDWDEDGHHLLGFPYNMGGPTLVECDEQARRDPGRWAKAQPEERINIEREVTARWRLLLQVTGSDATKMDWAGGGVLHYCIPHESLRRRDFSNVWLNMQFL